MPLKVKIQQELADGFFKAVGKISYTKPTGETVEGPAEVLVRKVTETEYLFDPTASVFQSKIDGREVEDIYHCKPTCPDKRGNLNFSKFHIKFKSL